MLCQARVEQFQPRSLWEWTYRAVSTPLSICRSDLSVGSTRARRSSCAGGSPKYRNEGSPFWTHRSRVSARASHESLTLDPELSGAFEELTFDSVTKVTVAESRFELVELAHDFPVEALLKCRVF